MRPGAVGISWRAGREASGAPVRGGAGGLDMGGKPVKRQRSGNGRAGRSRAPAVDALDLIATIRAVAAEAGSGTLTVRGRGGQERRLYFQDGLIKSVAAPGPESDTLEEAKIAAQADQLGAARTRLIKAFIGTIVDARKVLTPEQWKKLQARRGEMMRSGGPGFGQGPGGWGGAERPRGPGFLRQEAPPEPPAPPEAPEGSL